ncbi:MAG: ABC transporter ATP-binding protein [Desulfobacteraceae bacterium]|nr:ABC transporter ATP-binding protein [Desulfobacteraceae bacterium]
MLKVENIQAFYGKIQVLRDVNLDINQGELVALVGANGAGKTTLLNTISGLMPKASGSVKFLEKSIDNLLPSQIVEMGFSHIPEGRKLFSGMSVRENLEMGAYPKRAWKKREETLREIYNLFPILEERSAQFASTLSGGQQQMLAMGRGLMSKPRLCAIDEPSNGLAPMAVLELFKIISSLRDQGVTVLLIEQNVKQTLEIADRAYVLENGRVVLEGSSGELLESDHIRKAYMGL